MIEIVNRQRKVDLDKGSLAAFAARAHEQVTGAEGKSVTVVLVSDRRIRQMNRDYRGKNGPTDVLSFPFGEDGFGEEPHLGDIVISAETASRQAGENGLSLELELRQLLLHGILHLAGYDHETDSGTMNRLELKLRKKLGIEG